MRYPIGVQSFEKIIKGGYVDKTDLVYDLQKENVCFLCRPRRFGKSLLVSTLEAYFKGRKELFKGLHMEHLEQDWTVYPVFHIDFSNGNYNREGELVSKLNFLLSQWEEIYGKHPQAENISDRFRYLYRIGVGFSQQQNGITEWKVE